MTDEEIMDEKPRQTLEDLRAEYDAQQEYEQNSRNQRREAAEKRRAADTAEWARRAELNQQLRDSQRQHPGLVPIRVRFQ